MIRLRQGFVKGSRFRYTQFDSRLIATDKFQKHPRKGVLRLDGQITDGRDGLFEQSGHGRKITASTVV